MRIARMLGWKVLLEESGIGNKFACGIRNPGLWNPESSSMNSESHQQLESEIQVPIFLKNEESSTGIWKSTAWNPESKTVPYMG